MNDSADYKPAAATPSGDLYRDLMNPNISKSEREHFAARRIADLEAELARLREPLGDEGKALVDAVREANTAIGGKRIFDIQQAAGKELAKFVVRLKRAATDGAAYIERQAAALVLKDEQLAEAVGGREFNGSRLRQYIERCNDLEAQLAALVLAGERVKALEAASHGIIDRMCETYMARNGRRVGIQGDDGEKCWIVHSDEIEELRRALTDGSEGGD